MKENELHSVILAGLLHDIGKFEQRTGLRTGQNHSELSGRFVNEILKGEWQSVAGIVYNHHIIDAHSAPNPYLTRIVTLADWLASGERRELEDSQTGHPEEIPLISIFSILNGSEDYTYFPLTKLPEDGNARPQREYKISSNEYLELWRKFYNEAQSLTGLPFMALVNNLLALLEKYTVFVPAAAYRSIADVSLYHHLKLTAAIAACLCQDNLNYQDIEELLNVFSNDQPNQDRVVAHLVGGDISGIQNFIYNLRAEGALKGLRGRSLYLQLIAEAVAGKIIERFNLGRVNLIYIGGGHFYILTPAPPEFTTELAKVIAAVEQILLNEHKGKIGITIASQPVKVLDFKRARFGTIWDSLHEQLAEKKRRRFATIFADGKYNDVLGPKGMGGEGSACIICGEEIEKPGQDEQTCQLCHSFAELGRKLHKAKYLIEKPATEPVDDRAGWERVFTKLGMGYDFSAQVDVGEETITYVLNRTAMEPGVAGFRFIGRYVPVKNGETAELKDIADEAEGVKRWGVLRADVDNLSRTFIEGLGKENRSISRLSMLSYLIGYFFSARVEALAQSDEFRDSIYLAYSGGDDLFLIGAWSKLPEFARRVYDEFHRFTSDRLTLSAGIFIAPSEKFPVYQAARMAGRAEEAAKGEGRDALSLLGKVVKWQEYPEVWEVKNQLVELLKQRDLPRALLGIFNASWAEFKMANVGKIPMFPVWRLIYALTRLKEREKNKPEMLTALNELERKIIQGVGLHPHLDLITRWAELETRRKDA
jgi:CRISPR-associated protein Csm1